MALADRLHLVRVPALEPDDALPITLEAVYAIELRAAQYFHPETVPVILRHQETFAPDQAFPGKAIEMCKALTKHSTQSVTQKSVLRLAGVQIGEVTSPFVRWFGRSANDTTNIVSAINRPTCGCRNAGCGTQ